MTEQEYYSKYLDVPICIYLRNGLKLSGIATEVSPFTIVLTRDSISQDVLYGAMATIGPNT